MVAGVEWMHEEVDELHKGRTDVHSCRLRPPHILASPTNRPPSVSDAKSLQNADIAR